PDTTSPGRPPRSCPRGKSLPPSPSPSGAASWRIRWTSFGTDGRSIRVQGPSGESWAAETTLFAALQSSRSETGSVPPDTPIIDERFKEGKRHLEPERTPRCWPVRTLLAGRSCLTQFACPETLSTHLG